MYRYIKDKDDSNLTNCIQRISDNASIPFDEANTDYQEYLQWLDEGNTPEEAQ